VHGLDDQADRLHPGGRAPHILAVRKAGCGSVGRLVAALFALCSGSALATADGPDHFSLRDVAAGDVLNIRAEPDAKARKVGEIPAGGQCIRNLGCQGGLSFQEFSSLSPAQQQQRLRVNPRWCRVEYRGATGWVAGRYLAEAECRP
jgi:hypothetical protein